MPIDVVVLVGSLRRESLSRAVARAVIGLAQSPLALSLVEIGSLPLYNEDLEARAPAPWIAFRERIRRAAAVLFVTPEYNRSIPGLLKNAIDVGSRPSGQSAWNGKPAAVISISPGQLGAFGANHHLRQALVFTNMPVMQQPEAYLSNVRTWLDGETITNPQTEAFLRRFLAAFAVWIERNGSTPG